MKKMTHNGFTFVELIIITVILIILSSIGFISYTAYISGARDTNRISQLNSIRDGLEILKSNSSLPYPENSVQILASGISIGYQGYAGNSTLARIDFKEGGKDPKDNIYFSYYLTENKKYFQLMTFLEEEINNTAFLTPLAHAAEDYTERFPRVTGNNLGILTDAYNSPIQEVITGSLDIVTTGTSYIAYISNTKKFSGDGTILKQSIPNRSCKRINEIGGNNGDGIYTINPSGAMEMEVYCDMTTTGGGWTLVHKTTNNSNNLTGTLDTTEGYANWDTDNEYRLSINYWKDLSTEAIMAKNIRVDGFSWDDITDATISNISTSGVTLNKVDPYYIFNIDGTSSSSSATFDGTNYWRNSTDKRYVNNNDSTNYGTVNQPMIAISPDTSYSGSAVEGAGGTNDSNYHVLSKMGIFIK